MTEANDMYKAHLDCLVKYGNQVTARGLNFKETAGIIYQVPMASPIVTITARDMGYKFAIAEPYWILSGSNRLDEIKNFGKMAPYSDEGYFMRGAYGPKIVDQLPYVCKTLADDKGSRQAVLNIWRERPGPSKDIPCTIAMQFMIRDDKLHCFTFMRSSDAIMGLPYDTILFSLTSAYVISILKHHYNCEFLTLGDLSLFIGSAHLYDKDIEWAKRIVEDENVDTFAELDFNPISERSPDVFMHLLEALREKDGILAVGELK